jgi:phospholipase C
VQPGTTVTQRLDLRSTAHWYDVTARSAEDTGFLRRFAGHVETGLPGVSDPAIATG